MLVLPKFKTVAFVFFILALFDSLQFIAALFYLYFKCEFRYHQTTISVLISELKDGFKMFLTNLSICSILNSGTLILGLFFESKIVGIYSVAEKIIMLCKHTIGVLFQGVFPKIVQIGTHNLDQLNRYLRYIFKSYLVLYSIGMLIIWFFADWIVPFLSSQNIAESSWYLMLLSPLPLIAALNQSAYMSVVLHEQKNIYFSAYGIGLTS